MKNDYSWALDRDYIKHSGAHLSDNWTTEKQSAYNKWYYRTHKEKWDKSVELAKARKARKDNVKAIKDAKVAEKQYDNASSDFKRAFSNFMT